jgi:hypothetical protein
MSIRGDNMTASGEVSGEAATPPEPQDEHGQLREDIENLLDEFDGVVVKRLIADEIVDRLVWPELDKLRAAHRRDLVRNTNISQGWSDEVERAGRLAEAADNVIRAVCERERRATERIIELESAVAALSRDIQAVERWEKYHRSAFEKAKARIDKALAIAERMRSQLVSGPELDDVLGIITALSGPASPPAAEPELWAPKVGKQATGITPLGQRITGKYAVREGGVPVVDGYEVRPATLRPASTAGEA